MGAVVVDIRPIDQRQHHGDLSGAVMVDRNILDWRLDPTSPDRLVDIELTVDTRVIICNEGFSSSLAATTLQELGLSQATDRVGGYRVWVRAVGSEGAWHGYSSSE